MSDFSWMPVFQAMTDKLSKFESDQSQLVAWLKEAGIEAGITDRDATREFQLDEIDPFTFFGMIMKFGLAKRVSVFEKLLPLMDLKIEPPTGESGLPSAQAQKVWLFAYKMGRDPDDIPCLWCLFNEARARSVSAETFNRALHMKQSGMAKHSHYMF